MKIVDEHTEMNSKLWGTSVIPSQSNENLTRSAPIQTVGIEILKNANHVCHLRERVSLIVMNRHRYSRTTGDNISGKGLKKRIHKLSLENVPL